MQQTAELMDDYPLPTSGTPNPDAIAQSTAITARPYELI